ncbi:MAG TPA: ATP-binding protein [Candidatus Limnocylindria bacterium]
MGEVRPGNALPRVALVLVALAIAGALVASLPHAFAVARDAVTVLGDVAPWIAVLAAWLVVARRAQRPEDVASLPASAFSAAIVWGGGGVLAARLVVLAVALSRQRPATVAVLTTVEDVLYAFGLLALGSLAAYALTRASLRATHAHVPATVTRDVPVRTRLIVITAGASFATAGVLLDVLVDFERTSGAAVLGYLVVAAALVAFASLVGWLFGDDIALRERAAAATAAERDRIARELHDGVAKSVSILALEAATAASRLPEEMRPELVRIQHLARLLSEEMRAIVTDVRMHQDTRPFLEALRAVVDRHAPAHLEVQGDLERIGTLARFEVLRIVDEALTNASRHAGASRMRARVAASADRATVEIEDDGRGIAEIDLSTLPRSGRYGLLGIRERAELLRGEARLERSPLGGTMVRVDFPLSSR